MVRQDRQIAKEGIRHAMPDRLIVLMIGVAVSLMFPKRSDVRISISVGVDFSTIFDEQTRD
jgi:hypothetical protein